MSKFKKGELMMAILQAVGVAGILVGGAVCPGILRLLRDVTKKKYAYPSCYRALKLIDKKGWMIVNIIDGKIRVRLTARGRAELLAYEIGQKRLQSTGPWDGKWHVLIFDIEETKKHLREKIRHILRGLGFERLQDSVWVYPFDCREVLGLLRVKYGVRHEALYLRADALDNDRWLRRHYHLNTK